ARPAGVVGGDVDVLADAPLRGLDEQDALLAAQPPDDARIDPFDYLDDLPLGAAAVVDAGFADHDTIAVQHLLHLVRAEVQILAFVRHDEAIALRVPLDAACDEARLLRHQDRALAVAQDLRLALHRGEPPLEGFALVARDREALRELGVGERHAGLGERLQDQLAAGDGIFVARRFPVPVGIVRAALLFFR